MIYFLVLSSGGCLENTKKKNNEDCRNISRRMVKYDVMNKYEIEKEKLKQQLAKIHGRVCLTSDCWTACTNIS